MSNEQLTARLEDCLEAISTILLEKDDVRPKDIAQRLDVESSAVTQALQALAEKKLIHYTPHDSITLTAYGKESARDVIRRHEVLRDFFVNILGVNLADADDAACQMEHSVPPVILERFIQFADFMEVCPRTGQEWEAGLTHYCQHGTNSKTCEKCLLATVNDLRRDIDASPPRPAIPLSDLKVREKAVVTKISADGEFGHRLIEMGVVCGAVVRVERVAPLGDPLDIKVKGYHLSLRKDEARQIEVERLQP